MHRLLLGDNPGYEIDHIDRDKLNNQLYNLRWVTRSQNVRNSKRCDNAKGYCWSKRRGKWQAEISIKGKGVFLGYFNTEMGARRAYEVARDDANEDQEIDSLIAALLRL